MEVGFERRLVLFLDILGFKTLVRRAETDANIARAIGEALETFAAQPVTQTQRETLEKDAGGNWSVLAPAIPNVYVFSDNLLASYHPCAASLAEVICRTVLVAGHLLLDGILVRGGICVGALCEDLGKGIVVGQGLIDAYELERDAAVYPRVVLHSNVKTEIYDRMRGEEVRIALPDNIIRLDKDGFHYVDVLSHYFRLMTAAAQGRNGVPDDPTESDLLEGQRMFFARARASITGLRTEEIRPKESAKIGWLIAEFNSAVKRSGIEGVDLIPT